MTEPALITAFAVWFVTLVVSYAWGYRDGMKDGIDHERYGGYEPPH